MPSRGVTDESMITWRTDDDDQNVSVIDTDRLGRLKFKSPVGHLGARRVVNRSSSAPLAVSFGDFNPWAGDWSEVVGATAHDRKLAAPTSVYWCTSQSVDAQSVQVLKDWLLMYKEIVSFKQKIEAGNIYGGNVGVGSEITWQMLFSETQSHWVDVFDTSDNNASIGPWYTFPDITEGILSCLNQVDTLNYYQGDRARVKVSPSPFGGDTHGQMALVHATLQSESSQATNSPMGLYNYTEIASLPILGSTDTVVINGGLNIIDNISAWGMTAWDNTTDSSNVDDHSIAAPDVALDSFINPDGTINNVAKLCFPLFINQDPSYPGRGIISYYQPHLIAGGDGHSAKVLVAAGGTEEANGFISSGTVNDMSITSAGLQIGLPDADGSHQFWIDGTKVGHRGSYGISDGDRPWHNTVIGINSSISAHYTTTKAKGDGSFSVWQYGMGYNSHPVIAADWPVIGFHINPTLKSCVLQAYSLAESIFPAGTEIGIETASFTQPFISFQWEDVGGQGSTSLGDVDLKGYRYKFSSSDMTTPKGARVDSRKAAGGHKLATITTIPFIHEKVKMWVDTLSPSGVQITTGRFAAISSNDTGLVETVGGPIFGSRPQVTSNVYCTWTGQNPTEVIGRFTLKVI